MSRRALICVLERGQDVGVAEFREDVRRERPDARGREPGPAGETESECVPIAWPEVREAPSPDFGQAQLKRLEERESLDPGHAVSELRGAASWFYVRAHRFRSARRGLTELV